MLRNALSTIWPKSVTSMASLAQGLILLAIVAEARAGWLSMGFRTSGPGGALSGMPAQSEDRLALADSGNVAGDYSHHSRLMAQRWLDSASVPEFRFMIPSDVIEIEAT
jgi:hypothetical protein